MLVTTVSKWGNSLALRIPQQVATELGVVENMSVSLNIEDGRLYIQKKITLDDMIASITPENVHKELLLKDGPLGKELL
jgi:antitoxin MazE